MEFKTKTKAFFTMNENELSCLEILLVWGLEYQYGFEVQGVDINESGHAELRAFGRKILGVIENSPHLSTRPSMGEPLYSLRNQKP